MRRRHPSPLARLATLAAGCGGLFSLAAAASEPLLLTYIEKPPYYHTDAAGVPRGFMIERTRRAMARAGIDLRLESRPPNRALHELRSNHEALCSIGWFRNVEREAFARFSLPLYHDQPLLLAASGSRRSELPARDALATLLAGPSVRIGAVSGYSYGEHVDKLLSSLGDRVDRGPSPSSNLAKLVAGRFDLALFNSEELDHLLAESPESARQVRRIGLTDVPPGKARHLMCSHRVDVATMARIDRAISDLRLDRP